MTIAAALLRFALGAFVVGLAVVLAATCTGCATEAKAIRAAKVANVTAASLLDKANAYILARLEATARVRAAACAPIVDPEAAKLCRHQAIGETFAAEAGTLAQLQRYVDAQHVLDDMLTAYDACQAQADAAAASLPCQDDTTRAVTAALPAVYAAIAEVQRMPASPVRRAAPAASSAPAAAKAMP